MSRTSWSKCRYERWCWGVLCYIRSARQHDLKMLAVHLQARWLPNTGVKMWAESWVWTPDLLAWQKCFIRQWCLESKNTFHAHINLRQSTLAYMPVCKCQLCYLKTGWLDDQNLFLQAVWSYRNCMITLLHWYSSALCVFPVPPIWRVLTLRIALPFLLLGGGTIMSVVGFGFWEAGLCAAHKLFHIYIPIEQSFPAWCEELQSLVLAWTMTLLVKMGVAYFQIWTHWVLQSIASLWR